MEKRAAVITLGCKVNQFESSSLTEALAKDGYGIVDDAVSADLIVINTCTVTQKADQEALALVRRLNRLNPAAKIVATGCLAQSNPGLLAGTGMVSLVLGQSEKPDLVEHVGCLSKSGEAFSVKVTELKGPAANYGAPAPEKTRAFYKIQDGCSAHCAYCAVPSSRGPSRSLIIDHVLEGLRSYLSRGIPEVVICGIHLGRWGRDLEPSSSLADLLHIIDGEISPDADLFRVRLSSIEPLELDDDILAAFEMYPWLAPHFHLPLQSGSNRVLQMMGRPYTAEQFRETVMKVHAAWPLAAIGIDIMAGFPGETEEDFEESRKLVEELPVSYFHVFPYSRRPGTPAADSPEQVPEHLKRARTMKLKELNKTKRLAFIDRNIGQVQLALVENTAHRPSGRLKLLCGNYISALLPETMRNIPSGALLPVILSAPQNPWGLMEAEPVKIQ